MNMRQRFPFLPWHWLIALVSGVFLALIYPQTQWDHALIAPYFDSVQQRFFLKDHAFLTQFMHQGLKNLMILLALIMLAAWAASWKYPKLQAHRRRIGWILCGMGLAVLIISMFKSFSNHACPWDLSLYGGFAAEIPLWGALPIGAKPGQCMPGGHASGGYALLAFYFGLLDLNRRWAYAGLAAGLIFGTAMGWAQMMRGAHFLSHNLWTLWTIWVVLLLWYCVWPPVRKMESTHV
ncbi:phosphatase PAP2 family protein [Deefgea sp. CFH1-16]|uniref:phosphatase PAP2 family protein n=1 Tax=Deefgea sp. CFH1-16 TaxID=2675457 RepID=UPI0015F55A4E|nr:phosphatase PAP2 family protein [Deefgea sp. CFH1-16]MBM5574094.1 phosphatase PAP2 family protein [Deefgea sp. CFH1-16]